MHRQATKHKLARNDISKLKGDQTIRVLIY